MSSSGPPPLLKHTLTKVGLYTIGTYTTLESNKSHSFLRLLNNKGFREESMTKVGLYTIGTYTTLESNKSLHALSLLP